MSIRFASRRARARACAPRPVRSQQPTGNNINAHTHKLSRLNKEPLDSIGGVSLVRADTHSSAPGRCANFCKRAARPNKSQLARAL